jgi:hypothetical protein
MYLLRVCYVMYFPHGVCLQWLLQMCYMHISDYPQPAVGYRLRLGRGTLAGSLCAVGNVTYRICNTARSNLQGFGPNNAGPLVIYLLVGAVIFISSIFCVFYLYLVFLFADIPL